jgi:hypothetical protein
MTGNTRRLTAIMGITTVTVCAVGTGAWALTHRHSEGPAVPKYATAREMATQAGCAATFHSLPTPSGVQSAGECTVSGHHVGFRVQRTIDTADPWQTRKGSVRAPNYVGNGWIVHSRDVRTLDVVGAKLAP